MLQTASLLPSRVQVGNLKISPSWLAPIVIPALPSNNFGGLPSKRLTYKLKSLPTILNLPGKPVKGTAVGATVGLGAAVVGAGIAVGAEVAVGGTAVAVGMPPTGVGNTTGVAVSSGPLAAAVAAGAVVAGAVED